MFNLIILPTNQLKKNNYVSVVITNCIINIVDSKKRSDFIFRYSGGRLALPPRVGLQNITKEGYKFIK